MTPADVAASSRTAQGLPARCADPSVLAALVAAINPSRLGTGFPRGITMAEAHADPKTGTVATPAEHDAVRRQAATRPGRSDRTVPKADPTRVRV